MANEKSITIGLGIVQTPIDQSSPEDTSETVVALTIDAHTFDESVCLTWVENGYERTIGVKKALLLTEIAKGFR